MFTNKIKIFFALSWLIPLALNASLDKSSAYYENGEYKKAIQEAKASKDEYANPQLHLIWAKSAEALGELDAAMSAYERVVMLDEENVDAKVKLAEVYNKTSRYDLAMDTKKELNNYQLTPEQRLSLGIIKGEDINRVTAQAKISMGYDTNINVSADDEKSSLFSRLSANASYINELGAKKGWYARADLKLYNQNNIDEHYYDMFVGGLDLGMGYAGNGYSIYMPVGYSMINYLDVNMLDQISLTPKINFVLNEFIINTKIKYSQRNYKQSDDKKYDDTSYGLGAEVFYLMGKDFTYVNFLYESFSADSSDSEYINRDALTLSAGINYNLSKDIISKLDYRYRMGMYDDEVSGGSEKRKDDYHQFEVKFSHYMKENFELYLSNRYVMNNSNNTTSDYTKNITIFGLSLNY